jgi:hypothetical protein
VRASHVQVPFALSPLDSIEVPEDSVNLCFIEAEEKKQGSTFHAPFDLRPRCFDIALFLAWANDRRLSWVTHVVLWRASVSLESLFVFQPQIEARLCRRHSAFLPPVEAFWTSERYNEGPIRQQMWKNPLVLTDASDALRNLF